MINTLIGWISRALLVVASLLAMGLAFIVLYDVVSRTAFNSPLRGTAEIVASAIVVIAYLQVTYAIASGGMMQVTLITDLLPPRARSVVSALTCALGVLLFFVIAWGSIDGFATAWTAGSYEGEGALRVPTWPVRLAVLVGSALATLTYGLLVIRHIRAAIAGEPASDTLIETGAAPNV